MRVLVLGGCGFIGSHVVEHLLAEGRQVRVLDRGPEKFRPALSEVEYLFGDYGNHDTIVEALADVDVVLHLASATVPGTAALDAQNDVARNLVPTIGLLESMRKLCIPRLVYLSSGGAVYGAPERVPTPEDHPLRPSHSYGIVKVAIEQYMRVYERNVGLSTMIIRPSNPYGPRQGHMGVQGVIGTFLNLINQGKPIQVWGDGSVVRDYLYITDLVELVAKAVSSNETGVYNAGSGSGISIADVLATLEQVTLRKPMVEYYPARTVDVPCSILDISRARVNLDWQPQTNFLDGVRFHWEWIVKAVEQSCKAKS